MSSYLATVVRLAIMAGLAVAALGLARVFVQLQIEQRRRRQLAATRDISALTPVAFEQYVGLLFEEAGYQVKLTGGRNDQGIDLVVKRRETVSVVQCKRYDGSVGPKTVREFIGAMTNANVNEGYLITTSGFTPGAEREARKAPYKLHLIDGKRLVRWARAHGLPGKLMAGR